MKNVRFLFAIVAVLASIYFGYGYINSDLSTPWNAQQIMQPEELVKLMNNKNVEQPLILNIGFAGNIKNATEVGASSEADGINKLKTKLRTVAKNKLIVFYCGCCPYKNCPNIRPAFKALKDMGFSNFKLLDLPENLKIDWINKNFPMQ